MVNYYVGIGGDDEDYRGNNSCGIWIHDNGLDPSAEVNIEFDPAFGGTVFFFEIAIEAYIDCTLTVFDSDGAVLGTADIPNTGDSLGCNTIPYSFNTPNGLGSFTILGGGVEGNVAIDDVKVTTDTVATEDAFWGTVKALYR